MTPQGSGIPQKELFLGKRFFLTSEKPTSNIPRNLLIQ